MLGILWLLISLLMRVVVPLHMFVILPHAPWLSEPGARAVGMHFWHAYHGAIRHAITVGFISLTIMGMAAKFVPQLAGLDSEKLPNLWLPFLLVNVGCAARVALKTGTDFVWWAFPVIAASGVLEVVGIAVWAVHLLREMNRARVAAVPALTTEGV